MIQWVLRSYIDADALFTLRNKFQFLVEKNVLECRSLLLRHIYDPVEEIPWWTWLVISSTVPSWCSIWIRGPQVL